MASNPRMDSTFTEHDQNIRDAVITIWLNTTNTSEKSNRKYETTRANSQIKMNMERL